MTTLLGRLHVGQTFLWEDTATDRWIIREMEYPIVFAENLDHPDEETFGYDELVEPI